MAKQKSEKQSKKVPTVPNPHDHFFRHTFLQLDHAKEFLEAYLPQELLAHLDLDGLQHEPTTYVDERLAEHLSDVLYEAPLHTADPEAQPASIYFLLEHKSTPEKEVLLQLLRYMYERWIADIADGKSMRLIIPVVFYHGNRKWNIPTRFIEQFKDLNEIFHAFIPNFQYLLFDTSDYEAEQICQLISSGSLQAALLLLKYIYDQTLDQKLDEILDPLAESDLTESRKAAQLQAILTYVTHTGNSIDEPELVEVVREKFANEEGTMSVLIEEWAKRGHIRGLKEGIALGRIEKQRETIRNILTFRFIQHVSTGIPSGQPSQNDTESTPNLLAEAVTRLEYVETESELDALVSVILTVPNLESFLQHLPTGPAKPEALPEIDNYDLEDNEITNPTTAAQMA